ncbi:hypothetical protein [Erythrobacter colymbi]|uniref:hypothetical protein n=1 Tax=Erythrobacter colymbi TaxID=1161202 RepID=UPI000A3BA81A|nr:hypothetical protein [Erythrobacter colymbi]
MIRLAISTCCLFAALCACSDQQAIPPAAPIDVTLEQLVKEFDQNQVAAEQRYANTPVRLTATVASIKGSSEEPLLNLSWTDTLLPIQAKLAEASKPMAADLLPGDQVELTCAKVTEVLGTPMLGQCAVEKNAPTSSPAETPNASSAVNKTQ